MIYFIQAVGVGNIKIGHTEGDPHVRLDSLQTGSPVPLRLLGVIPGTMEEEKNLHRRFKSNRVVGEWFRPSPELLALIPQEDVMECDGLEIVEQSVAIRVLTVGRKQFSKRLLDQLPSRVLIDWDEVYRAAYRSEPYRLSDFVSGIPWGWVHEDWRTRCMIFQDADNQRLAKQYECTHRDHFLAGKNLMSLKEKNERYQLFMTRMVLPGFRPEDQLFFGV